MELLIQLFGKSNAISGVVHFEFHFEMTLLRSIVFAMNLNTKGLRAIFNYESNS